MELGELTARVERVSHRYAAEFGIGRSSDWHILKLHEVVGELTQVHRMREGQARSKGRLRQTWTPGSPPRSPTSCATRCWSRGITTSTWRR
jgi:hypothetical protein